MAAAILDFQLPAAFDSILKRLFELVDPENGG